MKNIYDYKNNIKVTTTTSGDRVISMNPEALVVIRNCLYDAVVYANAQGRDATAKDIMKLWEALFTKEEYEV